ncbi:MAG: GNAT family N-acetyltransferase [Candidatus Binatia bacterium]
MKGTVLAGRLREAAGKVYDALPQTAVDVLGTAHPLLALAQDGLVPLAIARGRCATTAAPASALIAGRGTDARYFLERFFSGPIEVEDRGRVSLTRLPAALRRERDRHDLTIARVDRIGSRFLFDAAYHRLPDWVGTIMSMPNDVERFASTSPRRLRSDFLRVRRNDLRWLISNAREDFDRFYTKMYLPFLDRRHGALGVVRNVHQLLRAFRAGCLLWVLHRGEPISAILLTPQGDVLRFVVLGTRDGALEPIALGGLAALYIFAMEYAKERGFRSLDLGGVRPCLSDGALQYKLKWGVRLRPKPEVYHDFLFYWPRPSKEISSFLEANPLVVRRGNELVSLGGEGCSILKKWE